MANNNKTGKDVLIVGSGPASVLVIGALLDHPDWIGRIHVITPDSAETRGSGRMRNYKEVLSNTPINLFNESLSMFKSLPRVPKIEANENRPSDYRSDYPWHKDLGMRPCRLGEVADMFCSGFKELDSAGKIVVTEGLMTDCDRVGNQWNCSFVEQSGDSDSLRRSLEAEDFPVESAKLEVTKKLLFDQIIFCSGAEPLREIPPVFHQHWINNLVNPEDRGCGLNPEIAFNKSSMLETFKQYREKGPCDVVLAGYQHTGAVIGYHIFEHILEKEEHSWFDGDLYIISKHLPYYARPGPNGTTINDNGGLKENAAFFTSRTVDPRSATHMIHKRIHWVELGSDVVVKNALVINCCGYVRREIPGIDIDDHCGVTGQLKLHGKAIPGLFGYGVAFPEVIFPSEASRDKGRAFDYNVGLYKFAKYLSAISASQLWNSDSRGG